MSLTRTPNPCPEARATAPGELHRTAIIGKTPYDTLTIRLAAIDQSDSLYRRGAPGALDSQRSAIRNADGSIRIEFGPAPSSTFALFVQFSQI